MFRSLIKRIALALDERAIPYMIFGGQAVLLYGEPRLTEDIDITVGADPRNPNAVLDVIKALRFEVLVDDAAAFLRQTFVLPVLDTESGVRIDFVFALSVYEQHALQRTTLVELDGVPVRFIALEDLIVVKTIAGRPRDLEDIARILLKHPEYDRAYVEKWLSAHDQELGCEFLQSFLTLAGKTPRQ